MRTAREVVDQIVSFAAGDPRVRAALLNGSRADPTHTPDLLSDYDVLLSVTDVESFARDEGWLAHFGAVLLMQRPQDPPPRRAWLVLFDDGVRIDFTLSPLERIAEDARADSLTMLLLDKDGRCPPLEPPSARSHFVRPPTQDEFAAACNEFWWVLVYAAKGLWRRQIVYAKRAFDGIVRPEMERILAWYAGARHGWAFNPGSLGKHLQDGLPSDVWQTYEATFAAADIEANWAALFAAARLTDRVARAVAARLGLVYNAEEAENALRLITAIRALPRDAHAIDLARSRRPARSRDERPRPQEEERQ